MAFPLCLKPRSTRGVEALQDPGIHGTTLDFPTRSGTEQSQTTKAYRRIPNGLRHRLRRNRHRHLHQWRLDGLAFDKEKKLCVFLEYTRAMDTNEDWAEKKEQEKNDRYSSHLGFINHLSNREKSGWKASQINFTTGSTRLPTHKPVSNKVGVTRSKKQEHFRMSSRKRTVHKNFFMLDMIFKFFFIALNSKTVWTIQSLPTESTNKNMDRFNVHLQSSGT